MRRIIASVIGAVLLGGFTGAAAQLPPGEVEELKASGYWMGGAMVLEWKPVPRPSESPTQFHPPPIDYRIDWRRAGLAGWPNTAFTAETRYVIRELGEGNWEVRIRARTHQPIGGNYIKSAPVPVDNFPTVRLLLILTGIVVPVGLAVLLYRRQRAN